VLQSPFRSRPARIFTTHPLSAMVRLHTLLHHRVEFSVFSILVGDKEISKPLILFYSLFPICLHIFQQFLHNFFNSH
jgi:hypothetical protein